MRIRLAVAAAALITAATALVSAQTGAKSAPVSMVVYKSPTCGCCSLWIKHLLARGFVVEARDVSDSQLTAVAIQSGVPADLQTCHTAKVNGYIVEGHVPAADIERMLKEKPAIAGIGVGGMPMGSPGMEQGGMKQPFNTMAFTKDGRQTVFAKH